MEQGTAKILVVDDNPDNRALAQATLEDEGYATVLASNAADALLAFERERPDCVLLDVRMPGKDGFAVCREIRELEHGKRTPIVFLTALRDVDTFDQALRAGGDDFLTKPVRPTELVIRVQAALKLHNLSAELLEHYEIVRRQRDDLMRLQLQKERLAGFVVHDLKNPVNAIDLHAQLLLRDRELSPNTRASVQQIRDAVRTLMRMVVNLLDISKSEEGRLAPNLVDVDFGAMLASVTEAFEVRARNAGVSFATEIELERVRADPELLRRVIENLIDNAIRHAPSDSTICVSARCEGPWARLCVADTGAGVAPDLREKIFERYVQLESGERVISRVGQGLGLTYCKLAIECHGGQIWVQDAQPGAAFCIRLPHAS